MAAELHLPDASHLLGFARLRAPAVVRRVSWNPARPSGALRGAGGRVPSRRPAMRSFTAPSPRASGGMLGRGRRDRVHLAALALLIAAAAGCAQPVQRRDWSDYDGPGAAAFHRESLAPPGFPDPLEPLNRAAWAANHALIVAFADPVGWVYRFVIPRFARERIRDFSANLVYPRNLTANL